MTSASGDHLAFAARASRKDVRDAVSAARRAVGAWSRMDGYRRGQVLYRITELLEERADQLANETFATRRPTGEVPAEAVADPADTVAAAIDRWLWYAGWADKFEQVLGGVNPVVGPYTSRSVPEATGVVGIFAPEVGGPLSLVSVIAPATVGGNTVVVIIPESQTLLAATFGEILAASDLPSGVINLVGGSIGELGPWLAGHRDVDAIDLTGVEDLPLAASLEAAAAGNVKRVVPWSTPTEDWSAPPGLGRIAAFCEVKTVWESSGI